MNKPSVKFWNLFYFYRSYGNKMANKIGLK